MDILPYAGSLLLGVFFASVAQAMLKYSAMRQHVSWICMYLNPWVIGAYIILFGTTFLAIYAYRGSGSGINQLYLCDILGISAVP